nr:non-ribosomal peptide synthetase [Dactylosporangium thailandense]
MRRAVAELLDEPADAIDAEDDLIRLGLDSVRMMRLAAVLRQAGADVTFADMLERPTLAAWAALLGTEAGPPEPAAGDAAAENAAADDDAAGEPFELAPMQHAYWVGRAEGQPLGGVGAHFYNEFDGRGLDPDRLAAAGQALMRRHAMLRARFTDDGRQVIDPVGAWPGPRVHDLRHRPAAEVERELHARRQALSHRRLDVDAGEVFDIQLTLLPGGRCRTHVNIEMLVADAYSFRILLSDLAALYRDPEPALAPIAYDFRRYVAERAGSRGAAAERDRDWWRARLDDLPGPPELPFAVAPERIGRPRVTRRYHRLEPAEWEALAAGARAHGTTLAMVFVTAYAEVLGRWSDRPRFLLNLPLYDREPVHPDVAHLVGDFTNLALLAVDVGDERPFAARVKQIQGEFAACASHAACSGVDVLRDLARRHPDRPASAPVVFTSALSLGELFDAGVRDCFGEPVWTISQTPQVWLDHQVTEREGGLYVNWDAVDGLFAPDVLDDMFAAYLRLLAWLGAPDADWNRPAPDLLPPRQRTVRERVNDTAGPLAERGLHEGFFAVAADDPGRTALAWGDDRTLTYGELAGQALRVAGWLAAGGVRVGEPVAVTLPKGPQQVIAVVGVLAAGGVYVPVGVEQPEVRRERIHRGAGVRVVLDAARLAEALASRGPLPVPVSVWPGAPAYIIYTSGSTGEPKGVVVAHRAAVNTIDALNDRFGVGPHDRVLAVSALDFDLSVYDIFGLLSAGGGLVLVDEESRRDAAAWCRLVRRHGVTLWQSVPALLDMLLTAAGGDELGGLRLALLGGDWVGLDLPARLAGAAPHARLVALGGTTETAIHSTVQEVAEVPPHWTSVPYGVPLRNQVCRVVDEAGRDRPDRVAGELWIGGESVAQEYRGDQARTARQFVVHAGRRWYRTGDLARYLPDGTLEFLGRADHQVKIRGHRIELGEVEAAFAEHPLVRHAVVVAVRGARTRLAAAVDAAPGAAPADLVADLTAFVAARVPAFMVPAQVTLVDSLPLSGNGKIDRAAVATLLAAEPGGNPEGERANPPEPPRGPVEATVAEAWAAVLDMPAVGRDDSFFQLGGDSLLATRMIGRLRAAGLGARLGHLYSAPVLRDFAAGLRPAAAPAVTTGITADPAGRHDPFPATETQLAYWLGRSEELGGAGTTWYLEFDAEDLDLPRLERAWRALVDRHEMLRVVFDADGRQRILAKVDPYTIAVARPAPAEAPGALDRLRLDLAHAVLDPAAWPLFDIRAVCHGGNRTRLGVALDYLAFDALSIMTVYREWATLYRDPDAVLPEPGLSFRDYVLGAHPDPQRTAIDRQYWSQRIPDLPAGPQLPLRTDPATLRRPRFARRETTLTPQRWHTIGELARRFDLTASTVLATAYAEVLAAWSGQSRFSLVFTVFDRADVHPDIGGVVGDFTSLLLVDFDTAGGGGFLGAARLAQRRVFDAIEHRGVSALPVLREMARRSGAGQVAVPVVFTSTLGVGPGAAALEPPFDAPVAGLSQTPQVWLDHQVTRRADGGVTLTWDAVEELFPPGVLDDMFDAYGRLLDRLAEPGADWSAPVPALLPPEQARVRAAVNATDAAQSGRRLHDGFFARAAEDPGRIALAWGADDTMTYGELSDRALRVAGWLAGRGVGGGEPVAVTLPKGPDQVAGVLGVLAAGGAYVPVGVDQPVRRRDRIREASAARLSLDQDTIAAALLADPLPRPVDGPDDRLAYVIFTSGSTGEPKGVELTHRAAMNTVEDVNERYGVGPDDRVLAVSALDFDLSVYDLFGLLSAGGTVVLLGEDGRRDPDQWLELMARHRVTVWNSVPALLDMLLLAAGDRREGALRLALVSGDWVGLDLPERLGRHSGGRCRLVALGGATETAIWSNAYDVGEVPAHWTSIPYGLPLRNQRYRVADDEGRDCPDWVAGELWIGGAGVALGYRGDPARTAARFVEHGGTRWYRTGDLGRYWPDGTLEFLGRTDNQVKIGGHRVELGEIEAALRADPAVEHAVAVAVGERVRRLAAAVVPVGEAPSVAMLRAGLATRVPAYMVPEHIVVLDALPLNPNGKVDRAAVAALAVRQPGPASSPPDGPVEQAVSELWRSLLELDRVGRDQNFFVLGGDSLLATRLVQALRDRFGVALSLPQLFAMTTVADQARHITQMEEGEL